MNVQLNPDRQVSLAHRKRMAVELLVSCCTDRNALLELIEPDTAATRNFTERLTLVARQCVRSDEDPASIGRKSLIDLLREIEKGVSEWDALDADVGAKKILKKFASGLDSFDCYSCGKTGCVCNGVIDPVLLQSAPNEGLFGGKCLEFVVKLVEAFAEVTIEKYRNISASILKESELPEILVESEPWLGQGTLAVDGELVPPGADDGATSKAIVRVFWPRSGDLSKAILQLPYLLFHEVFVHWVQGHASSGGQFQVDSGCNFTEGAVDSVACEVLDDLLRDDRRLPGVLSGLRESIREESTRYHEERCAEPPAEFVRASASPADDIFQARRDGRTCVHRHLQLLQRESGRDEDWANKIILLLNLQLTREERETLYFQLRRMKQKPKARSGLFVRAFDAYLENFNLEQLTDRLSGILNT